MLLDLFTWWILSISWSIVFLIVIGFYLYIGSSSGRTASSRAKWNPVNVAKDLMILWFLLALLIFYIVSVYLGSATFFAVGNIVVEVLLILYVVKNRMMATSGAR